MGTSAGCPGTNKEGEQPSPRLLFLRGSGRGKHLGNPAMDPAWCAVLALALFLAVAAGVAWLLLLIVLPH